MPSYSRTEATTFISWKVCIRHHVSTTVATLLPLIAEAGFSSERLVSCSNLPLDAAQPAAACSPDEGVKSKGPAKPDRLYEHKLQVS